MSPNLRWRGIYDNDIAYEPGDVVHFPDDGFNYVCINNTSGVPPYIENSGFEFFSGTTINLIDAGEF